MAWAKVTGKYKKPWRWWLHKILCEYGWLIRNKDYYSTYYHHLNRCCKQGFNLYGERIDKTPLIPQEKKDK